MGSMNDVCGIFGGHFVYLSVEEWQMVRTCEVYVQGMGNGLFEYDR